MGDEAVSVAQKGINRIPSPKMFRLRVISGKFMDGSRTYSAGKNGRPGEEFDSLVDLRKNFPNTFELVGEEKISAQAYADAQQKLRGEPSRPLPVPAEMTTPCTTNVTDKFVTLLPAPGSHWVWKHEGLYYIWNLWKTGAPQLLNKIGVNKGQVDDVLKADAPPLPPAAAAAEQSAAPDTGPALTNPVKAPKKKAVIA